MEATHYAPKSKKKDRYLIAALLLCATLVVLFLWAVIPAVARESRWSLSSIKPSKIQLPILAPRAPPYQDSCVRNDDCDWGYKCIDNTCYHGCDEDRDCLKPQFCGVWFFPSKYGADFCLVNDFRVCKIHLDFCRNDEDCCSGNCQRKNIFWRMCQPSTGRSRANEE